MWLSYLRKRTPSAYFLYVLIVLVLLSIAIIDLWMQYVNGQTTLLTRPYQLFLPIIGLLLASFCNRVFVISDTFQKATLWPGYFYVLLLFNVIGQTTAYQALTHGTLSILIAYELLKIQFNSTALKNTYNLGAYIGIAFILKSEMIFAIPFLLYAITNLKPLNFREYILYFLGILTPLYFLYAYSFVASDFTIWNNILPYHEWFQFSTTISIWNWIQWGLVIIVIIIALFLTFIQYNSLPVYIRRMSSALLFIIGAVSLIAMVSSFSGFLIFYLAPAFAFFATMLMLKYSNNPRLELIHIIFVIVIVGTQLANTFIHF